MTTTNSALPTITPRFVHEASRATLIEQAIQGYLDAGREIPLEWIGEYLETISRNHLEPRFELIVRPKNHSHRVTTNHPEMRIT